MPRGLRLVLSQSRRDGRARSRTHCSLPPRQFVWVQLAAFQARALELVEKRRALKNDRWAASRLPCVFLEEERCSVYPVRPLTCRGFTSSDARACERSYRERPRVEIPVYEPQLRIATFVLDGMRAGLTESGLKGDLLELTAALHIALAIPDALERWRVGEPVFASARLP